MYRYINKYDVLLETMVVSSLRPVGQLRPDFKLFCYIHVLYCQSVASFDRTFISTNTQVEETNQNLSNGTSSSK